MSHSFFDLSAVFWLTAGVLIGVAASLTFGSMWMQVVARFGRWRAVAIGGLGIAALAVTIVTIYLHLGRPDAVLRQSESASLPAHPFTSMNPTLSGAASSGAGANSMEAVTAQLAARLGRSGGSDSDWQLLAQSYEFLGREQEAAMAREHKLAQSVPDAPKALPTKPLTAEAAKILAKANKARVARHYDEARTAYEQLIKLDAMSADTWADFADVLASARQGSHKLSGAPAEAIDKALALDPNHPKALWLKASLAYEEHRYADALRDWRQLRAAIGDNSPDTRIIDANIAEAQQLAGEAAPAEQTATAAVVAGTIDIDPKFAAGVAGATLFVFAKDVNAGGPPLAVYRTTVTAHWPMHFKLDDSMAMMPTRTLSSVTDAVVSARISRSGQAIAAAGDFEATAARVNVRDGKTVHLRIDKIVG